MAPPSSLSSSVEGDGDLVEGREVEREEGTGNEEGVAVGRVEGKG